MTSIMRFKYVATYVRGDTKYTLSPLALEDIVKHYIEKGKLNAKQKVDPQLFLDSMVEKFFVNLNPPLPYPPECDETPGDTIEVDELNFGGCLLGLLVFTKDGIRYVMVISNKELKEPHAYDGQNTFKGLKD